MQKKDAEELLEMMIELLLLYIDELFACKGEGDEMFQYGERTAFTECLEWIQLWRYAEVNGLDFNIEEKYPL